MHSLFLAVVFVYLAVISAWAQDATTTGTDPVASDVQLVFIRMPNKQIRLIHAKSVETQDDVLTVTDLEGKPSRYQANLLIAKLPGYTDAAVQMKDDDIQTLLAKYDGVMAGQAEIRNDLSLERGKFKAILDKRKADKQAQEAQIKKAQSDFTTETFDPAKDYKAADLKAKLEAGENLKSQYPTLAGPIDTYLAPWQERAKYLEEGRMRFEGKWMKLDEIRGIQRARKMEQMKIFLDTNPKLTMAATAVDQGTLLLGFVFMTVSLLLCLYMVGHILAESRTGINLLGWVMILISLGLIGIYGYYGVRVCKEPRTIEAFYKESVSTEKSGSKSADKPENKTVLIPCDRLLYLAAEGNSKLATHEDKLVTLTDREINETLKKRLSFSQANAPGKFEMLRDAVQIQFLPDRVLFLDQAHGFGKSWLFRYELYYRTQKGLIEYYKCDVSLGKTRLPEQICNYLWRNYQQRLLNCLKKSGIPRIYQIEKIEENKVTLVFDMQRS